MTSEYDLARYTTTLLLIEEKLVDTQITDNGYLVTNSVLDCIKVSNMDTIIGRITDKLEYEAFTGALVSKSNGLGKIFIIIVSRLSNDDV